MCVWLGVVDVCVCLCVHVCMDVCMLACIGISMCCGVVQG